MAKPNGWDAYVQSCRAIWNDVKYFPIPQSLDDTEDKISYVDPGCLNEITEETGA